MQVKVDSVLVDLDGDPIKEWKKLPGEEKPVAVDVTLKKIVCDALLAPVEGEKFDGLESVRRYALARKVYAAKGSINLTAEDTSLVKRLVGLRYAPLVVGQAFELLDPAVDTAKGKKESAA